MEVDLACALPSGLLRSHPAFVRCRVLALIDSRCRALNNKQLLRVPSQMRDGLNGRRAGSDNGHPLVSELAQYRSLLAATGVIVVPTCGVKSLSTEILHAADPWHFGRIDRKSVV